MPLEFATGHLLLPIPFLIDFLRRFYYRFFPGRHRLVRLSNSSSTARDQKCAAHGGHATCQADLWRPAVMLMLASVLT